MSARAKRAGPARLKSQLFLYTSPKVQRSKYSFPKSVWLLWLMYYYFFLIIIIKSFAPIPSPPPSTLVSPL